MPHVFPNLSYLFQIIDREDKTEILQKTDATLTKTEHNITVSLDAYAPGQSVSLDVRTFKILFQFLSLKTVSSCVIQREFTIEKLAKMFLKRIARKRKN